MPQNRPDGCCMGTLSGGTGWDGLKRTVIGYCLKTPREGFMTCHWHRSQESSARRLKAKLEAEEEANLCAVTCFHCGEPAMKKTHGFDPRCERHRDV